MLKVKSSLVSEKLKIKNEMNKKSMMVKNNIGNEKLKSLNVLEVMQMKVKERN